MNTVDSEQPRAIGSYRLIGSDPTVVAVAEFRGCSYECAYQLMQDARERYGLTFQEFVRWDLHRCETDASYEAALLEYLARESAAVRQVSLATGWSEEQAESRMRSVKERFPWVDLEKYANGGYYRLSNDQIAARVERATRVISLNQESIARSSGWTLSKVVRHMEFVRASTGIGPVYYTCYRAWRLTHRTLETLFAQRHSDALTRILNAPEAAPVLNEKDRFHREFADLAKRGHWINRDTAFKEFAHFSHGLERVFCKPLHSRHGRGTFVLDLPKDREALRSVYDDLVSQSALVVEEHIAQHESLDRVYSGAINTIRVITVQCANEVDIVAAPIRFGRSGITDNFSGGGLVCDVDVSTGRIATPAIALAGDVYEHHPETGFAFEGFQIPHWEEVLALSVSAARRAEGLHYVGWDIAVGPNGASLVEGNAAPGAALVQAPYAPAGVGRKHLVDRYLQATSFVA